MTFFFLIQASVLSLLESLLFCLTNGIIATLSISHCQLATKCVELLAHFSTCKLNRPLQGINPP